MMPKGRFPTAKLGTLATMSGGGTPPSRAAEYYGGGILWASISDMTSAGKHVEHTARTLSAAGLAASGAKAHEPGTVLYAMYASLGECSIAARPLSSSQAILGIRCGGRLDPEFLYYYLQWIKPRVKTTGQHGTQSNLNQGMVQDLDIPLPTIEEQRRIGAALADVDNLISAIEQLIAKKRSIMHAMMQQLVTGRTRLKGYSADWLPVTLGSVARMNSGGTPPSTVSKYYGGTIPWVSVSDLTGGQKYIRRTEHTLSEEGLAASPARLYDKDVLLYAMYASLGECGLAEGRVSSSQAILGISVGPRLDREFLYYYLQFIKPKVKASGQQGTQPNLNAGMVRDFVLLLPERAEQTAIAQVLADADREIDALQRRRESADDIKTGMAQQLLTGDMRLPLAGRQQDARPSIVR